METASLQRWPSDGEATRIRVGPAPTAVTSGTSGHAQGSRAPGGGSRDQVHRPTKDHPSHQKLGNARQGPPLEPWEGTLLHFRLPAPTTGRRRCLAFSTLGVGLQHNSLKTPLLCHKKKASKMHTENGRHAPLARPEWDQVVPSLGFPKKPQQVPHWALPLAPCLRGPGRWTGAPCPSMDANSPHAGKTRAPVQAGGVRSVSTGPRWGVGSGRHRH